MAVDALRRLPADTEATRELRGRVEELASAGRRRRHRPARPGRHASRPTPSSWPSCWSVARPCRGCSASTATTSTRCWPTRPAPSPASPSSRPRTTRPAGWRARSAELEAEVTRLADAVRDCRRVAAERLAATVEEHLADLAMPHAHVEVAVAPTSPGRRGRRGPLRAGRQPGRAAAARWPRPRRAASARAWCWPSRWRWPTSRTPPCWSSTRSTPASAGRRPWPSGRSWPGWPRGDGARCCASPTWPSWRPTPTCTTWSRRASPTAAR